MRRPKEYRLKLFQQTISASDSVTQPAESSPNHLIVLVIVKSGFSAQGNIAVGPD
ncbi:hypothetical protein PCANC_23260 [Puccinia coronata f. sp. avenae]|uniref:Uncharacterized protein n=1 Tax=Puccinia coronata f. sp. avenae TaxID=200324 RepID=A0A2N5RZT6_9BASI|nr:hypothetical protein PCANC_25253 [Puccinia coronata f. sp. avenae]PLW28128.1 hypothetical protein PCANC_23260 [Puccinia coronata f. sp. avenae]